MKRSFVLAAVLLAALVTSRAGAHVTIPLPPPLPAAQTSGYAPVNGVKLWYAEYGAGAPVILIEGGLDSTAAWGYLIPALAKQYRVIAIDTRCQGRSTCSPAPLSYHLFAQDMIGAMNHLHLQRAAVVGWSDGAIIGIDMALHHPDRVTKLFAYGANSNVAAVNVSAPQSPESKERGALNEAWEKKIYEEQSPTPNGWSSINARVDTLWLTQPDFTAEQLRSIRVPTWIVDGDRDDSIKRSDTDFMARTIPGASEMIFPHAGHHLLWTEPGIFTQAVLTFLEGAPPAF
jgi:pimeloyl-ACP methyl ester carboxylesterase